MKKIFSTICAVLIVLTVMSAGAASVYASEESSSIEASYHHVLDSEGLLSEKNCNKIEKAAASVYEKNGVDLFTYVTEQELEDPDETGKSIYKSTAYTKSSLIMLIDAENIYIRTYGRARYIFTTEELEAILDESLNQKNTAASLLKFVKMTGSQLTEKGVLPVPDERLQPRLVDDAALLSESEQSSLLARLDEISERQQLDVVVVTNNSLDERTVEQYADDFYDYNGYGYGEDDDGILLLVSMDTREWAISTFGKGIDVFTDDGQKYITDKITSYLHDGDYYEGFNCFADLCDEFISQYNETGVAFDYDNMPKEPFGWFGALAGASIIGLAAGLIVALSLKSQLTSVAPQATANAYAKKGSLNVTERTDLFLYHNITRTAKPKDNEGSSGGHSHSGGSSTHTSSSGRSHGGSHGHF